MNILGKIDAAIYRAERFLAATLFLFMSLVMFANVMQRVFSRTEGRLSAAFLAILGRLGLEADPAVIHGPVSLALNLALTLVLAYGALRTIKKKDQPQLVKFSKRASLLFAAAVTAGLALLIKGILLAFPNGVVWAPPIALSSMLWVGFIGASMATYEKRHLALEMGEKIWPQSVVPIVRGLALVATAGLCIFLLLLACLSIQDHFRGWLVNHLVGNLDPTPIPRWCVFLIFPYTFVVMILRFLGQVASREVTGEKVS
ncbi:MAG: TRAP transporter small permease [Deltaproteobacteria bacterium]|nr:TRAP transporter small permease [Deltaproteobacteria bacterium]